MGKAKLINKKQNTRALPVEGDSWTIRSIGTLVGGSFLLTFAYVSVTFFLIKFISFSIMEKIEMEYEAPSDVPNEAGIPEEAGGAKDEAEGSTSSGHLDKAPEEVQVQETVGMEGMEEGSSSAGPDDLRVTASKINRMHLDRKRPSGAQRRKTAVAKAKELGLPLPPRYRKKDRRQAPGAESNVPALETPTKKRQRSEVSTPSSNEAKRSEKPLKKLRSGHECEGPSKRSAGDEPASLNEGTSYSQALTGHKMAIVPNDYPEGRFSDETSMWIRSFLTREIIKETEGGAPTFTKNYVEKGVIFITCDDGSSRKWLESKVPQACDALGIGIKVGSAKQIVNAVKAIFWISNEIKEMFGERDPKKLIGLFKIQNPRLCVEDISILNTKDDEKGTTFVVSLSGSCLTVIKEAGYKLNLGLSKITVRLPGEKGAAKTDAEVDPNKPPS